MTDLEQAHHAGFMEGVELAQETVRSRLVLSYIFGPKDCAIMIKYIEAQIALAVANRMEDE